MSVHAVTWDAFYRTAQTCRYQHPQVLQQQVEALKPACRDLSPYVFRDPSVGALLIAKGKMLEATPDGRPPVHFAITLKPQFPNAYPILSIEPPPAGWRIVNHPNVDREGLCFLQSVTNWNPRQSTIFNVCAELQLKLTERYPYERASGSTAGSRARGRGASRQQPAGRGSHGTSSSEERPQQSGSLGGLLAGLVVAALFSGGGNSSSSSRTRDTTTSSGDSVRVLNETDENRARQQRQQDREWLQQQQQRRSRQSASGTHELEQQEHTAAMTFVSERFESILDGHLPVGHDTEVVVPAAFGLAGRMKTHPRGTGGPMCLARTTAPRPLVAVADPTPDERFERMHRDRGVAAAAEDQRAASSSASDPPTGAFSVGLRALSRGVTALSRAASSAKHTVESRVKDKYMEAQTERFRALFPEQARYASESLATAYSAKMICGDGVARTGFLFLTERFVYWSTGSTQNMNGVPEQSGVAPATVVKTVVPYASIVSLALGKALSDQCIHVICQDNSVRTFLDLHSSKTIELGSYVTSSVEGSTIDRCYNWLDHKWRAAVPMIPVPGYPYEAQLGQGAAAPPPPPAAQPAGIQGGGQGMGIDIPMPGPMYLGAANTNSGPSAAAATPAAEANRSPAPAAAPGGDSRAVESDSDKLCAICMDEPKNCFLRPCGHVATCMECAGQLRQCPICRSAITDRFQAFL